MDNDKLDELERVAREAHNGYPWHLTRTRRFVSDGIGAPHVCEMDCGHDKWEARANHISTFDPPTVLALITAARRPEPEISLDGPNKIDDHRKWLSRQLLDSKLTDEEVYGIVAYFPPVRDVSEARRPEHVPDVPLDVILHCPSCMVQHIDEPHDGWENPPHRTHLCQSCGHLWRAANVATNGVAMLSAAPKVTT